MTFTIALDRLSGGRNRLLVCGIVIDSIFATTKRNLNISTARTAENTPIFTIDWIFRSVLSTK